MAHRVTSLDELGPGVFRKLRPALGITAFGANGLVLPPGTGWFNHFHERQDELYFVHAGRAGFEVDGETFELGPGGAVHVESTTPRRFWNAGDEDLVLLATAISTLFVVAQARPDSGGRSRRSTRVFAGRDAVPEERSQR